MAYIKSKMTFWHTYDSLRKKTKNLKNNTIHNPLLSIIMDIRLIMKKINYL